MGVVLDTSVLVGAERGRFDLGTFLVEEAPADPVFLTSITASELLHGVERADGARRRRRADFVEDVLSDIVILPFDLSAARVHARLWADLERRGTPIGPHDLMIAAICVALGHRVATLNEKEFERIPELELVLTSSYLVKP